MLFNDIVRLYEDFAVYPATLCAEEDAFFDYVAPSSMHSGVTTWAYGKAVSRRCIRLTDRGDVQATLSLPTGDQRFWIKIIACLENWQTYRNDITVTVNGQCIAKQQQELFENVNLGWPALYYAVPDGILWEGHNEITVTTQNSSDGGLLLSAVDVVALPPIPLYTQIAAREAARVGETYAVAFRALRDSVIRVLNTENSEHIGTRFFEPDIWVLQFRSFGAGAAACRVLLDETAVDAVMPQICENEDFCLVGIDSDDHRHDCSDEADRIVRTFAFTGMGNYFQFRPQHPRNFYELAPKEVWQTRVDLLKAFGARIGLTDPNHFMPYILDLAGDAYFMSHVHEPYLFFNQRLGEIEAIRKLYLHDNAAVQASESFGESEALYRDVLRRRKDMIRNSSENCSIGAPSMLSVYESDAGFEYITLEPVSNMNLLAGTVRNKQKWGAHIPPDWYFGVPVDEAKARKFRLALYYLYFNGVSFLYPENATFKTNAHSREDWESAYCRFNRQYLREFYTYTVQHPREGELLVDKAVVYGRHEYFLWQTDDRIAELDAEDWDSAIWGKWEDKHRACWNAIRGWLPVAEHQSTCEAPMNKDLFGGTPYGNVDIVTVDRDWSAYKTVAFLGWNTMDAATLEKIKTYVAGGGTLVIAYCHFNMTDRNDRDMTFPESVKLQDLLGVTIGEEYAPQGEIHLQGKAVAYADGRVTAVHCETQTAEAIVRDADGEGLIFRNGYGKGTVYFCGFKDYFTADWAVETVKTLLQTIGEAGDVCCDDPNVSFTQRRLPDGQMRFDFLNMNCALKDSAIDFSFRWGEQRIRGRVKEGEPFSIVL